MNRASRLGGISVAEKRVNFSYNTGRMFTSVKRYNDLAGTEIVVNSTYVYDLLGRFTELDHQNAARTRSVPYIDWDPVAGHAWRRDYWSIVCRQ